MNKSANSITEQQFWTAAFRQTGNMVSVEDWTHLFESTWLIQDPEIYLWLPLDLIWNPKHSAILANMMILWLVQYSQNLPVRS